MGWSSKLRQEDFGSDVILLAKWNNISQTWMTPEIRGSSLPKSYILRSCEVGIIWPDPYKYPDAQCMVSLPIYLHSGSFWGKCRQIHCTLRIWDMVKFLTLLHPKFLSSLSSFRGWLFGPMSQGGNLWNPTCFSGSLGNHTEDSGFLALPCTQSYWRITYP